MKLYLNTDLLNKGPKPGNTGPKLPNKPPSQPKSFGAPKTAQPKMPKAPSQKPLNSASSTGQPGRPKGSGSSSGGVEWEYWSGQGDPPAELGYQKSESGAWRRPKGSGPAEAPTSEEPNEGGAKNTDPSDLDLDQSPPEPENVSDPLTNDDGSKVGEESLDVRDDGFETDPWEEERAQENAPLSPEDQAFGNKLNNTFDKLDQAVARQKKKDSNTNKLSDLRDLRQRNAQRAEGRQEVASILDDLNPLKETQTEPEPEDTTQDLSDDDLEEVNDTQQSEHDKRAQDIIDDLSGRTGKKIDEPKNVEDNESPFLLSRKKKKPEQKATPKTEESKNSPKEKPSTKATEEHQNAEKDLEAQTEEHKKKSKEHKERIEDNKKDISSLKDTISKKKKQISSLKKKNTKSAVNASERKISSLDKKISGLEKKIKSSETKVNNLKTKLSKAKEELKAAKKNNGDSKSAQEKVDILTNNLKQAQNDHNSHKKDLDSSKKSRTDAKKERTKAQSEHSKTEKAINDLEKEISGHEKEINDINEDSNKSKKDLEDSKENLKNKKDEVNSKKKEASKENKIPETDSEKIAHKSHTEDASRLRDTIDGWLAVDPENEDLKQLRNIADEQASIGHVPTSEDKTAMSRAMSYAKQKGFDRHPEEIKAEHQKKKAEEEKKVSDKKAKEDKKIADKRAKEEAARTPRDRKAEAKADKQREMNSKRGSSNMSAYNSGMAAGEKLSQATNDPSNSDKIISDTAKYGSKGVVKLGHSLLNKEPNENKNDVEQNKQPEKDKEESTIKEDTKKGMKLYLDLNKAPASTPNTAVDSDKTPEQNSEDYEESYSQRTAGAAGGDPTDLPGNGRKMNEEEGVSKGFFIWKNVFSDMKKSLSEISYMPHPLEEEFVKDVLQKSNVSKVVISGNKRSLFSDFVCDKLQKSLEDLSRSA